ncbi:MAG: HU family DNA-binding protein [Bacteroidaceae bacterium]|nr:HU family DNA-binding protein [Bacteroidaceae bacterium]
MGKIFLNNIAEELAAKSDIANGVADDFLRLFVETIEKGLQEDGIVKIKGLGAFKLAEMGERSSVDVNTGERIVIKGHTKVTFTPDSAMKELINRPFAHFEPTELNDAFPADEASVESEDEAEENECVEEVEDVKDVKDVAEIVEGVSEEVVATEEVEVVEEVVPAVESAEDSIDEHIEAVAQESVEESSEQPAEASVVEVTPISELYADDAVQLPQAEAVAGDEPVEIEEASASSPNEVQSQPQAQGKKRRGCGCVLFILLLLCSAGALYYWYTLKKQSYQDMMEEHSDIVVNPNLQEVLGAEWGNEVLKVDVTIDSVETQSEPTITATTTTTTTTVSEVDDVMLEDLDTIVPVNMIPVKEVNPVVKVDASFLAIPKSLSEKDIRDITIADTTDYVIGGTLTTHKLKNGETLIMLARKYYGDKRLWPYIVKYNHIADFNKVAIGMTVNIPELHLVED